MEENQSNSGKCLGTRKKNGVEQKVKVKIKLRLLSKREIESNFLRDFESSFLGDSESLFQGEIGSFTKAKMGVRRSLLTYSCAF